MAAHEVYCSSCGQKIQREAEDKGKVKNQKSKLVIVSLFFVITLAVISLMLFIVFRVPNPENIVIDYWSALQSGDYEKAEQYMVDKSYLFSWQEEEQNNIVFAELIRRIEIKTEGHRINKDEAVVDVVISHPDIQKMIGYSLQEIFKETFSLTFSDTPDSELQDERIEEIQLEALEKAPVVTTKSKVTLVLQQREWKLVESPLVDIVNIFDYEDEIDLNENLEVTDFLKEEYIREHIELRSSEVGLTSTYSGEVPSLSSLEFKNNGERDIDTITVTVYFKDAGGNRIAEDNIRISFYDAPLRGGYSWRMEERRYYELKNLTDEVDLNNNEVKITQISFIESSNNIDNSKVEYINAHIELRSSEVGLTSTYSGEVPSLSSLEFKNNGERDIDTITVTVYFKDAGGNRIAEDNIRISFYDTPLRGGYSWRMEERRYYELKNLTDEVDLNNNEVKIKDISFL